MLLIRKTLSLLCSALAWQQQKAVEIKAAREKAQAIQASAPNPNAAPNITMPSSVIVYASRTHTQIAQVTKELKATAYRPKMIVLGSRDQLCVHEKLSKLKYHALNLACSNMNKQHSCMHRNNLDTRISSNDHGNLPLSTDVMDIEDIVKEGKEKRFCPYYYSRHRAMEADLVLLPYNYLLDATMRSKISINWHNAVVIFDEAHNVERIASDAASFSLSSTEIASCIEEMQSVIRHLRENAPKANESASSSSSSSSKEKPRDPWDPGSRSPSLHTSMSVLKALFAMEHHLDTVPLSMCNVGNAPACILPGNWMKSMLEASGFQTALASTYINEIHNCISFLEEEAQATLFSGNESGITLSSSESKLHGLLRCLQRVFRYSHAERPSNEQDYKVFICEKMREISTGVTKQYVKTRVLNYWAFSPGIAMEDLKMLGVRSIILTSGTLSPMNSFADDMKLPFPIQLQNDHVIT
jgi:regulator of telomere elongation helicase 1